ncbi:MAG: tRNA (adenosine(37)-N6)-threonylcarbamoyltransferase complex ATPase subunit type 1 TsaE [Gammaproteobacteria bacterium]
MSEVRVSVPTAEAMERLGARLAHGAGSRAYIALGGELGVGKTTLARGFLRAMGHAGVVKSPTYTIVESYRLGTRTVHHLDLYRVAKAEELEYLGIWDYFVDESVKLVEWPENGAGVLPQPDVMVTIQMANTGREVSLRGLTCEGERALQRMAAREE